MKFSRNVFLCSLAAASLLSPFARAGDFDGDGFDDLAIGAPYAYVDGVDSGSVTVMYGGGAGLGTADLEVLTAKDGGLLPTSLSFGLAVATGDFDADGYADLAVGAPSHTIGSAQSAGSVFEYRGSPSGLSLRRIWNQNVNGVKDKSEAEDSFGYSLAAGDFDGDGRADLAVGVSERVNGKFDAGAVHVLYGSKSGLDDDDDQIWHQNSKGMKDQAEQADGFGATLAAGDLNGDGVDDLAIGIPAEQRDHLGHTYVGAVAVLFGDDHGLSADADVIVDASKLVDGAAQYVCGLGKSLAIGDFDDDGRGDLAMGAPDASAGGYTLAGGVFVLPGAAKGLAPFAESRFWSQESANVPGGAEFGDAFGAALATGNFDDDGYADLAIGVPNDSPATPLNVGAICVLYGTGSGLSGTGSARFYQDTGTVEGSAETGDLFGASLGCGDFDGDGAADLAVGVPYEKVGGDASAGAINVLYGDKPDGVTDAGNQVWFEDAFPGAPVSQPGELFGFALGG